MGEGCEAEAFVHYSRAFVVDQEGKVRVVALGIPEKGVDDGLVELLAAVVGVYCQVVDGDVFAVIHIAAVRDNPIVVSNHEGGGGARVALLPLVGLARLVSGTQPEVVEFGRPVCAVASPVLGVDPFQGQVSRRHAHHPLVSRSSVLTI